MGEEAHLAPPPSPEVTRNQFEPLQFHNLHGFLNVLPSDCFRTIAGIIRAQNVSASEDFDLDIPRGDSPFFEPPQHPVHRTVQVPESIRMAIAARKDGMAHRPDVVAPVEKYSRYAGTEYGLYQGRFLARMDLPRPEEDA